MSIVFSLGIKELFSRTRARGTGADNGFVLPGTGRDSVMLVHGLTGTPAEMKSLAVFLNKLGYTVICPALANHGESIAILKRSRWQEFYASVRESYLRHLTNGSSGKVFAAGLSMGALLALLLADEFRGRIAGVSALAPTLFYDGWNTPHSKYLLPLGYHTPLGNFFYFKEEPPYGIKNEAVRERIHRYYSRARLDDIESAAKYGYPFFPVTLLGQLQLLVKHLLKRLPYMDFPVQLIQAKDDDMTSVNNSVHIYNAIKSEVKEIVLLYDSYHVVTADQEREIVAEKVAGFFSRC